MANRAATKSALDLPALASWLWEAACIIRGPVDAPKLKDYILPATFLKRLSDVVEDEIKRLEQDFGGQQKALKLAQAGKRAVVLDTGAVSRGSGNQGSNKERDLRKAFEAEDLIEAVFLLPENLFYNTTAPGIILVVNRRKRHAGQILLVNGAKQLSTGRPKNYLEPAHITALADAYLNWRAVDGLSAVISTADAARKDFNLSPSRYVSVGEQAEVLPLDEALVELREAEGEFQTANRDLEKVLKRLGLG